MIFAEVFGIRPFELDLLSVADFDALAYRADELAEKK